MNPGLEKAIELFGEMQSKYGCHFKRWCRVHSLRTVHTDEYEIVEFLLFPLYEGFEILLDEFILNYCTSCSTNDVEISEEAMNQFITELGVLQCHQKYLSLSLLPENLL